MVKKAISTIFLSLFDVNFIKFKQTEVIIPARVYPQPTLQSDALSMAERVAEATEILTAEGDAIHQQSKQIDMSYKMGSLTLKYLKRKRRTKQQKLDAKQRCITHMHKARQAFDGILTRITQLFEYRKRCLEELTLPSNFKHIPVDKEAVIRLISTERSIYDKVNAYAPEDPESSSSSEEELEQNGYEEQYIEYTNV